MMPANLQSATHFLSSAFDSLLIGASQEEAIGLFERMADAASKIASPGDNLLIPLEEDVPSFDLHRHWFLDHYRLAQKSENGNHFTSVALGARQFRLASPVVFVGQGLSGLAELLKIDGAPARLGVNVSHGGFTQFVEQRECSGFGRAQKANDWTALLIHLRQRNGLRGFLGLPEKDLSRVWPWQEEADPVEDLHLAVRLAALLYYENPVYLLEGFVFFETQEDGASSETLAIDSSRRILEFGPEGEPTFTDIFGNKSRLENIRPQRDFVMTSRTLEMIDGIECPAITIRRSDGDFWIEQKSRGRNKKRLLPELRSLRDRLLRGLEQDNDAFESLPLAERMSLLTGAYYYLNGMQAVSV